MTILVPYRGVIEIFGGVDVGKTLASLQTVYPYTKTILIDADVKGSGTVQQMKNSGVEFGNYIDVVAKQTQFGETQTPEQLLKKVIYPIVEEIEKGEKQEVIIWDNWRLVYQAARMYVDTHKDEFSDVVTFRGNNQIIQGLVSRVARMIELKQINILRNKCELLVITSHLKDNYVNGVAVGERPESSKNFDEICTMRIWLRRNVNSSVPSMLFIKRPNLPVIVGGRLEPVDIVPPKVTPNGKDKSIWDAIARYEKEPIGNRKLREDETPTPEEFAMLSGTLTNDQKNYVLDVLKHQKETDEEISDIIGSTVDQEKEDEKLSEEINGTFPNSPKTPAEFLSKAMSEFGMSAVHISEKTGTGLDALMKADEKELKELWKKLQQT